MSGTFQTLQNLPHPVLSEQNFQHLSLPGQYISIIGSLKFQGGGGQTFFHTVYSPIGFQIWNHII